MPVVEIAKIQVRRGQENQSGTPVLDSGEFGWASDTEKLYIGLRRVDGGSRDANVRILTENDLRNFFQSSVIANLNTTTLYTFKVGTFIATSNTTHIPPTGPQVVRSIQGKLDDIVSIKDFGAIGDGINDDHMAFQTAIDNLYLYDRWKNTLSLATGTEKTLFLPKGSYLISQTLYIPSKVRIQGEGIENTKIVLISTGSHFFQTIDGNSTDNNRIHFDNTGNFSTSGPMGSPAPDFISLEKLSLVHQSSTATGLSFISMDVSDCSIIRDVKFQGAYTGTFAVTTNTYVGIDLRGYGAATTQNLMIENCHFDGLYAGIKSNYNVQDITIDSCSFVVCDRGISFLESIAGNGPKNVKITNSSFDRIRREAIYVGANSNQTNCHILSQNNSFVQVGNYLPAGGEENTNTGTSIIYFTQKGGISQNDYFARYESMAANIDANTGTFFPLIGGQGILDFTYHQRLPVIARATATVWVVPITGDFQNIDVKYSLIGATIDRIGDFKINISSGSNPNFGVTDNFIYDNGLLVDNIPFDLNSNRKFLRIPLYNLPPPGVNAAFTIQNSPYPAWTGSTVTGTYTNLTLVSPGVDFIVGDQIILPGVSFTTGTFLATTPVNNVYVTITGVDGVGGINAFTFIGTATNIINTATFSFAGLSSIRVGGPGQTVEFLSQTKILYS